MSTLTSPRGSCRASCDSITITISTGPDGIRGRRCPKRMLREQITRQLGLVDPFALPLEAIAIGPFDYGRLREELKIFAWRGFADEIEPGDVTVRHGLKPGTALVTLSEGVER